MGYGFPHHDRLLIYIALMYRVGYADAAGRRPKATLLEVLTFFDMNMEYRCGKLKSSAIRAEGYLKVWRLLSISGGGWIIVR